MKVVNRIKANEDFAITIKTGKTLQNDSFRLHIANNELGHIRVGVSVSKKLGNAVIRNRVKRQIRAICDSVINYDEQALDIVVIAKAHFLNKTFADNKSLFSDLLHLQVGLNK
ncbi:MAG: ribonuclease P protein component [Bacilli bacterium]|nr:ribonuclease P protein component [Bacilli bacterium]